MRSYGSAELYQMSETPKQSPQKALKGEKGAKGGGKSGKAAKAKAKVGRPKAAADGPETEKFRLTDYRYLPAF